MTATHVHRATADPAGEAIAARGRRRTRRIPYLLLAPTAAVLLLVLGYPWLWALYISLTRWSATDLGPRTFIGLDNYLRIVQSSDFHNAVRLTVLLVIVTVPVQLVLGFVLASVLNTDLRGRVVFQTIYLMPMMVVHVLAGVAWRIMFHPYSGVLTYALSSLGVPDPGFMTNENLLILTAAVGEIWCNTPLVVIILLAGLRSMPQELLDAARVDGAGWLQMNRHVVLGYLRPFIQFAVVMQVMFELRAFDLVYGMFPDGGPGKGAQVLGIYLYQSFTRTLDFGFSSAVAVALLVVTLAGTGWLVRRASRETREGAAVA